jgi:hypothetical protein
MHYCQALSGLSEPVQMIKVALIDSLIFNFNQEIS